ncbi:MAG: amidohydrolase family protein [Gammaproteobacteria bacterium]
MTTMLTMTATRPDGRHLLNRAASRWRLAVLLPGLLAFSGVLHAETVAFIGVNVVPMGREVVLTDQTVLVEDETIRTIGPRGSVPVPEGARAIDASGQYLLPGLAEMHAHIPGRRQREGWLQEVLFLYVANGVTTARGMLGAPCHLQLREQVARHEVLGPRVFTSGPSLNGNSVYGVEQARDMVTEQAGKGYDFLKLHPGLSADEYRAIATTAAELEIPFAGHVPEDVGLRMAFASSQATIEHLDGYMQALLPPGSDATSDPGFFGLGLVGQVDPNLIPQLARETSESGVWNVPTLSLIENFVLPEDPMVKAMEPGMQYVPRDMLRGWIASKRGTLDAPDYDADAAERLVVIRAALVKAMHDKGAGLLLGSDAPQVFNVPGFSIHHELDALVNAGLTPFQALRTGTVYPAAFFGAADRFGSVAEGLEADLILVRSNPLLGVATLREPLGVMVRGHWLDRAEIDRRLGQLAKKYTSVGPEPAPSATDAADTMHSHSPVPCR